MRFTKPKSNVNPNNPPEIDRPNMQTAPAAIPEPSCPSALSLPVPLTIKAIIIVRIKTPTDE